MKTKRREQGAVQGLQPMMGVTHEVPGTRLHGRMEGKLFDDCLYQTNVATMLACLWAGAS